MDGEKYHIADKRKAHNKFVVAAMDIFQRWLQLLFLFWSGWRWNKYWLLLVFMFHVCLCLSVCVYVYTKKIKSKEFSKWMEKQGEAGRHFEITHSWMHDKQRWACQFIGFCGVFHHLLSSFLACQLFKCVFVCVSVCEIYKCVGWTQYLLFLL